MRIIETAGVTPHRVATNDELANYMDTNDDWIRSRTGIRERHVAESETTAGMASDVARKLLQRSGKTGADINFIVVATMSPDYQTPAVANLVQAAIGADFASACDLDAACAGFVYAMDYAAGILARQPDTMGMVIGSEVLSREIDWHDRGTAVLFGDGAAGVLVEGTGDNPPSRLRSFGESGLKLTAGGAANHSPFSQLPDLPPDFTMNGREIYKFATTTVASELTAFLDQNELAVADVDHFLFHQANARIIEEVGHRLGIKPEQTPINVTHYGNTSAASIPLLLNDLAEAGKITRGETLLLCGFGGGLNVAQLLIKY